MIGKEICINDRDDHSATLSPFRWKKNKVEVYLLSLN